MILVQHWPADVLFQMLTTCWLKKNFVTSVAIQYKSDAKSISNSKYLRVMVSFLSIALLRLFCCAIATRLAVVSYNSIYSDKTVYLSELTLGIEFLPVTCLLTSLRRHRARFAVINCCVRNKSPDWPSSSNR